MRKGIVRDFVNESERLKINSNLCDERKPSDVYVVSFFFFFFLNAKLSFVEAAWNCNVTSVL